MLPDHSGVAKASSSLRPAWACAPAPLLCLLISLFCLPLCSCSTPLPPQVLDKEVGYCQVRETPTPTLSPCGPQRTSVHCARDLVKGGSLALLRPHVTLCKARGTAEGSDEKGVDPCEAGPDWQGQRCSVLGKAVCAGRGDGCRRAWVSSRPPF